MRMFINRLKGKAAMTSEGLLLGKIANFTVETNTGRINSVLVEPADDIAAGSAKTDAMGRLIIPFKAMRAVKDVVIIELE